MANLLTCPAHPRYATGRGAPVTDCPGCWAAYGHRRAYDDGLASQGKTVKKNGRASKAKGRNAVVQVVDTLRAFFALQDDDMIVKATSQGGCDVHMSPLAAGLFPYAIEVKNQETLKIWAALKQAEANAGQKTPILFFTRAHAPMYVALRVDHFLQVLRGQKNPS